MTSRLRPMLLLMIAVLLNACGGSDHGPMLIVIKLSPYPATVVTGGTLSMTATGTYTDGSTAPITNAVWRTLNPAIATVTQGLVTGVSQGLTVVTATVGTVTGSGTLRVAGGWQTVAPMATPRKGHTATLLPDGRVLVAGGSFEPQGVTSSVEIYDPVAHLWSAAASMSSPRAGHSATLLADGTVLVAGGNSSFDYDSYLSSAEIYDPAANAWSAAGTFTDARSGHTANRLADGRVLVAGGLALYFEPLASAELYDPATHSWSQAANLQVAPGAAPAATLTNGKVLVSGGNQPDAPDGAGIVSAQLYDPTANTWTNTPAMTTAHGSAPAALLTDGKVFVYGGFAALEDFLSDTSDIYDPVANRWSSAAAFDPAGGSGLLFPSATLLPNGNVLVAGGITDIAYRDEMTLQNSETYDPATDSWTPQANMAHARVDHTATLLQDGSVLVTGGDASGVTCEIYR